MGALHIFIRLIALAIPLLVLTTNVVGQVPAQMVIHFPFAKYHLTPAAKQQIVSELKQYGHIDSITIHAHCDSVGSLYSNDTLSERRVNTVKTYILAKRQLSQAVFKDLKGFGKHQPLNDNTTSKERAQNRRAEVWIYGSLVSTIMTPDTTNVKQPTSILDAIQVGDNFTLENLMFYGSRHLLYPASRPILDTLVALLRTHPSVEIEIQGYICCANIGEDGYDVDADDWHLSRNRAKMVYEYLIKEQINPSKLSYKGFGFKPLVAERTSFDRMKNRRVEIKVLKK